MTFLCRKEIVQFSQMFNDRQLIEKSLRESEAELLYARAVHSFKSGNVKETVEAFVAAVSKRNELEKPEVQRLLRMKLQTMNTGREQIKNSGRRYTPSGRFRKNMPMNTI